MALKPGRVGQHIDLWTEDGYFGSEMDVTHLSRTVREFLDRNRITQYQLWKQMGRSPAKATIGSFLKGGNVNLDVALKILKACSIEVTLTLPPEKVLKTQLGIKPPPVHHSTDRQIELAVTWIIRKLNIDPVGKWTESRHENPQVQVIRNALRRWFKRDRSRTDFDLPDPVLPEVRWGRGWQHSYSPFKDWKVRIRFHDNKVSIWDGKAEPTGRWVLKDA